VRKRSEYGSTTCSSVTGRIVLAVRRSLPLTVGRRRKVATTSSASSGVPPWQDAFAGVPGVAMFDGLERRADPQRDGYAAAIT
jgi:hypothetical protein